MSDTLYENIEKAARNVALELFLLAGLKAGQTVVAGCSTSEIAGYKVGTNSNAAIGTIVFASLNAAFSEQGVYLAAQCCEHLNRAIIIEREAAAGFTIVNAVPVADAGGAFATAAYEGFRDPVALESILADAGIDIGGTLIGMHLKRIAVPLRLETALIGKAAVIAARTRPPLIGGARTTYDRALL